MRSYAQPIIAVVAIAVSVFSAQAVEIRSGSRDVAERNAREGKSPAVDKSSNGRLFQFFAYFKGVLPDDIYFVAPAVDSVGVHCDESGAPINSGLSRCKRYRSDSKGVTFVIRFARDVDRTYYFKRVDDRDVLVPYTAYDRSAQQTTYASGEAQQFASAHGLGTGVAVASTGAPRVAVANTYCASLPPMERIKCGQEARSPARATPSATQPPNATSSCATLSGIAKTVCENGAKFLGK